MPTSYRNKRWRLVFLAVPLAWGFTEFKSLDVLPYWGFYGHRLINRMAVYTLPDEMFPLFKQEIDYITEHAVDPDKR